MVLLFPDATRTGVAEEDDLLEALPRLRSVASGSPVRLERDPENYIEATRYGEHWSVTIRRGGWWTKRSFTAAMTSSYSERRMRQARAARSLPDWLTLLFRSPPPEAALDAGQLETLFVEFFRGRRFTLPFAGAAG